MTLRSMNPQGELQRLLRTIVARTPSQLRRRLKQFMPARARAVVTDQSFNRIDQVRLARFQASRQHFLPATRDFAQGLAVVVPCYNHARFLADTLESLARQTVRPFQAVFVEDHATDDTWAALQALTKELPSDIAVTLLQTPRNSGQAFAINWGIQHTAASVYVILNDDDYLMHDALEVIMALLQSHPDLFLVGASAVPFSGQASLASTGHNPLIGSLYADPAQIPMTRFDPAQILQLTSPAQVNMTHSGSAFFRSAWEVAGGYCPDKQQRVIVFSDRDFQLRVASLVPIGIANSTPFVFWRTDSSVDSGHYS